MEAAHPHTLALVVAGAFSVESLLAMSHQTQLMSQDEYRQACIDAVQKLADDVHIPRKLSKLGVQEKDLDFLAASAIADACTPGNPRDVVKEEVISIYQSIL